MTPTDCKVLSLGTRHVGRMVWRFAALPSTNDLALKVAQPGLAIQADYQTQGRGQHIRRWHAPPGSSLLCSLIVDPPASMARPTLLIAWVATALAGWVESQSGQPVRFKWPNDLLLGGRKVCGILTERSRLVVVGFGLNLNQRSEDFDTAGLPGATSLHLETGRTWRIEEVLPPVMQNLDYTYELFLGGNTDRLEQDWSARFGLLGVKVCCGLIDGQEIHGTLRRLDFREVRIDRNDGGEQAVEPERVRLLNAI